jgi:hypothetical protein
MLAAHGLYEHFSGYVVLMTCCCLVLLWLVLQGFDVIAMWADLDKLEAAAEAARAEKEKLSS